MGVAGEWQALENGRRWRRKGAEKKIGGVLASTVSYFSIQLSDTLSIASKSRKARFVINSNNYWGVIKK
jgi:hypothetical protein